MVVVEGKVQPLDGGHSNSKSSGTRKRDSPDRYDPKEPLDISMWGASKGQTSGAKRMAQQKVESRPGTRK